MTGSADQDIAGSWEFTDLEGERYYVIRDVDHLPPFFISVVSNSDHWLFVSSNGGLTAGRVSPENALFPYVTVDKIHDGALHTGSKTLVRTRAGEGWRHWEPFNREHDQRYRVSRHLYKNIPGNKLRFEEINHDLQLAFSYTWLNSDAFGFVRQVEMRNLAGTVVDIEVLDGLQNLLPAGTPPATQANASNLVDAYKWNELDEKTGLACYALYAAISDRAEPSESLHANTVFCLGLQPAAILLSTTQLDAFRRGGDVRGETCKRGVRGAYLLNHKLDLMPGQACRWALVANVGQDQLQVSALRATLDGRGDIAAKVFSSVAEGTDELARIMARADGLQLTAEEIVSAHHYANTTFNVMRGGIPGDQHRVPVSDFNTTLKWFNRDLHRRHAQWLETLPGALPLDRFLDLVAGRGDRQLERLGLEYLPITFGRRHGDPSRPWNHFAIRVRDAAGKRVMSYQGNWRDIFQNWEALAYAYPEFVEGMIAKFVNASTIDGYNPYRVTKEGIDWEVEEPDDPWSYIGYWGDHQIIYLLKLLEHSNQFHPDRLARLLLRRVFCYANVPYRIKPFSAQLDNPKATIEYDHALAGRIESRVAANGADGKLLTNEDGQVHLVNLAEKLLVPLLSKFGNLVVGGGIWLNTQRPEWNDANNALAGHGLSLVTLNYLRRYTRFLLGLLSEQHGAVSLSSEVGEWLTDTATALGNTRAQLDTPGFGDSQRYRSLAELGEAASRYRQTMYRQAVFSGRIDVPATAIRALLEDGLAVIDFSLAQSRRDDGLYHAYNLLKASPGKAQIETLYPMLEGQVAALSSGTMEPAEVVALLEAMFSSDLYRQDQQTFALYPDRRLPGFLDKNRVPAEWVGDIPVLTALLKRGDNSILARDAEGVYRFNPVFRNASDLEKQIEELTQQAGNEDIGEARDAICALYERVFQHRAFTGRSGTMFGFEGLGCIYWHMVAKLLLAVGENYHGAVEAGADAAVCTRLGELYYRIRAGLGFNKTPAQYGAFPADPYSHTPAHAGAQQPGMTGQVKEELLARQLELGIRASGGAAAFQPSLLRAREFITAQSHFHYLDVDDNWQSLTVPADGLAYTWCQTPVVMRLDDEAKPAITLHFDDGGTETLDGLVLPAAASKILFSRSGRIRRLDISLPRSHLFGA